MAELHIRLEENRYHVRGPGFAFEFPGGSPDNRKVLILFRRGFKEGPAAKHRLFSQEQIAQAIPDFPERRAKVFASMSGGLQRVGGISECI